MKYSSTVRSSWKEALHRAPDDLPLRVGHQAAHAGQLPDLRERPAGTGVGHHEDRVELIEMLVERLPDFVGGAIPQAGDRLVALLLSDHAGVVLPLDLRQLLVVA